MTEPSVRFGSFKLFPQSRVLYEDDRLVRLGSRAFDILQFLVENAGDVVSKERLIAHVWPQTFVEEANLRVHLAALRKILGEGQDGKRYIVNVVGRGYSFVAPCTADIGPSVAAKPTAAPDSASFLPAFLGPLIGRGTTVQAIAEQVLKHRLVTICGAPGIGKTSVALAVAENLTRVFGSRVTFVDLALIADPRQLNTSVATALGLPVISVEVLQTILAHMRSTQTLIILDNCEHVIDAAADFCEQVMRSTNGGHVLATSREALRIAGERLHRLPPLAIPPDTVTATLQDALSFSAVELFVNRAMASHDALEFTDHDVPAIVDVCRKLDGLPLAVELAAARVETLGVHALAKRLDDRLQMLRQGRRTALLRHQTLGATLDWSYGLLTEAEQQVLMHLAVFAGAFTSEMAASVAASERSGDVEEEIGNLVAKSLLNVDISSAKPRYRLLETTRAYALEKLKQNGDYDRACLRHAELLLAHLRESETRFETTEPALWLAEHRPLLDDVRSAIDWAMAAGADRRWLGTELTDCSATLFFGLHLSGEYRKRLERALEDEPAGNGLQPDMEMRLRISLGVAIFNTHGPAPELAAASTRALVLAEDLGSDTYQLRALWGLARERYSSGDYAKALEYSQRFGVVARRAGNDEAILVHARMMSLALHLVGQHDEARRFAQLAVAPPRQAFRPNHRNFYQYDFGVTARAHLARILWIRGRHGEAAEVAEEAIAKAEAIGSSISLCNALALGACPVALWDGDRALARARVLLLVERAADASLGYWKIWGQLYQSVLNLDAEDPLLDRSGERSALQMDMLGTFDRRLITPAAVQRASSGAAPWCAAELLRGQCTNLSVHGAIEQAAKEQMLCEALALAEAQKALSWAVRCAIDIAEDAIHRGRSKAAKDVICRTLESMSGAQSADVRKAENLLRTL